MAFEATGGHLCAVCQSEAQKVTIGHYSLCFDPRCADVAKSWMSKGGGTPHFSVWEDMACEHAGKRGGGLLMEYGVTDMAQLSPVMWQNFIHKIIAEYRNELRRLAEEKAPPF